MIATIIDKTAAAHLVADRTAALAGSACAAGYPVLTLDEIRGVDAIVADPDHVPPIEAVAVVPGILDECVMASIWTAETAYGWRDRIIPTEANETGLWYLLAEAYSFGPARLTGTTEPVWPRVKGVMIADGSVYWRALGAAPVCLWDLDLAAHKVFSRMLAKARDLQNVKLDGLDQFDARGIVENLQYLKESTAPFCIG